MAVGLASSVLPGGLAGVETGVVAVLSAAYVVWVVGYFVTFWCTTGQTPGSRLMRIRVIDAAGAPAVRPHQAVVRFIGLVLARSRCSPGFLIMLWDDRRRCLHDRIARTTVVRGATADQDRAADHRSGAGG